MTRTTKDGWRRSASFERQLFDNGYLLVKLFLHIGKKEQHQRIQSLLHDPDTAWRVSEHDRWQNEHYEQSLEDFEQYLDATSLPFAPWHLIDSTHRKQSEIDCLHALCAAIEEALEQKADHCWPPLHRDPAFNPLDQQFPLQPIEQLFQVKLDQQMSRKEYKQQLKHYQERLADLHNQIYRWKIPVILAYEGWDAAGKGGNIKRDCPVRWTRAAMRWCPSPPPSPTSWPAIICGGSGKRFPRPGTSSSSTAPGMAG